MCLQRTDVYALRLKALSNIDYSKRRLELAKDELYAPFCRETGTPGR